MKKLYVVPCYTVVLAENEIEASEIVDGYKECMFISADMDKPSKKETCYRQIKNEKDLPEYFYPFSNFLTQSEECSVASDETIANVFKEIKKETCFEEVNALQ